jgi:hypothetical protein
VQHVPSDSIAAVVIRQARVGAATDTATPTRPEGPVAHGARPRPAVAIATISTAVNASNVAAAGTAATAHGIARPKKRGPAARNVTSLEQETMAKDALVHKARCRRPGCNETIRTEHMSPPLSVHLFTFHEDLGVLIPCETCGLVFCTPVHFNEHLQDQCVRSRPSARPNELRFFECHRANEVCSLCD